MNVEEVSKLISESAARLARATELSRRDEKWWAFMEKEFWVLVHLAWQLRGTILKRGQGTEAEELSSVLKDKVERQIEGDPSK